MHSVSGFENCFNCQYQYQSIVCVNYAQRQSESWPAFIDFIININSLVCMMALLGAAQAIETQVCCRLASTGDYGIKPGPCSAHPGYVPTGKALYDCHP